MQPQPKHFIKYTFFKAYQTETKASLFLEQIRMKSENAFQEINYRVGLIGPDKKQFAKQSIPLHHDSLFTNGICSGRLPEAHQSMSYNLGPVDFIASGTPLITPSVFKTQMTLQNLSNISSDTIQMKDLSPAFNPKYPVDCLYGTQWGISGFLDWIWAQSATFQGTTGLSLQLIQFRPKIFSWFKWLPPLLSIQINFKNETYSFSTLRNFNRLRGHMDSTSLKFRAERNNMIFEGVIEILPKNFVGHRAEDTNGESLFIATNTQGKITVSVQQNGKRIGSFISDHEGCIGMGSRRKSDYINYI